MKPKDGSTKQVKTPEYTVSSRNKDSWNISIPKMRPPKIPVPIRTQRLKIGFLVGFLIVTLGVGFLGGWLGSQVNKNDSVTTRLGNSERIVTSQSQLIADIAKNVGPSVVSVDVMSQTSSSTNSFFDYFGGTSGGTQQQESAGTGVIINNDGLILTNRHVVPAGTTSVSVTLSDGTQLDNVQVVGRTADSDSLDIAFLKITDAKGHKLVPAVLGDSAKIQVGDAVVAIGNALGQFQNTVTSGIISGYGRSVQAGDSSGSSSENLDDLFQTDAAINEGNSGGPLTNMNGQVIGINTAIASNSQNVGFAIPINDIAGLIKQVEQTGKFQRPYLGVRYIPLTSDVAKQYGLSVESGAFIAPTTDGSEAVISGSPADQAGLKVNDVIIQADGQKIDSTHSLTSIIDQHTVGDSFKLQVIRDSKTIDITATLAAAPSS